MKNKYLVAVLCLLLLVSVFAFAITIHRASADPTTLVIDPTPVTKSPIDFPGTFNVSVKINNVVDLFGFDIKITWDNTVITFASLDKTPLNTIWPVAYFEPLAPPGYQTGGGYLRYAAVDQPSAPGTHGFSGSAALFTITFNIAKAGNFPYSTSIHFDIGPPNNVKLSDSSANPISATTTDGSYSMSATVPDISFTLVDPNPAKPYEYGKYFEVQVYASHITSTLTGYDLKVDYTSDLLSFYAVHDWGVVGTGSVDTGTSGVVHVSMSGGTPSTGDSVPLFTLTFQVAFNDDIGHIWRTTSPHTLSAQVSLDSTYGQLSFSEGFLNVNGQVTPPSTVNLTINLIKGDVDCNGWVNVADLHDVAYYYDQSVGPAPAKYDLRTDGTIDIYDLVIIATNFNYKIPDSPPT